MITWRWFVHCGFPIHKIYKTIYPEVLLEALKNKIALKFFLPIYKNNNDCPFK